MRLDKRDHRSLALWATHCAEHVLSYFEEKYPKDDRPRRAVEAGRAWGRGEIKMSEARVAAVAAHAAARDVDQAAARAAARAAGHAAATAHMPAHAPHAAAYAVKASTYAAPFPPTLPPLRSVIGSTDVFRSTFGRWHFPPEARTEAMWTAP